MNVLLEKVSRERDDLKAKLEVVSRERDELKVKLADAVASFTLLEQVLSREESRWTARIKLLEERLGQIERIAGGGDP